MRENRSKDQQAAEKGIFGSVERSEALGRVPRERVVKAAQTGPLGLGSWRALAVDERDGPGGGLGGDGGARSPWPKSSNTVLAASAARLRGQPPSHGALEARWPAKHCGLSGRASNRRAWPAGCCAVRAVKHRGPGPGAVAQRAPSKYSTTCSRSLLSLPLRWWLHTPRLSLQTRTRSASTDSAAALSPARARDYCFLHTPAPSSFGRLSASRCRPRNALGGQHPPRQDTRGTSIQLLSDCGPRKTASAHDVPACPPPNPRPGRVRSDTASRGRTSKGGKTLRAHGTMWALDAN